MTVKHFVGSATVVNDGANRKWELSLFSDKTKSDFIEPRHLKTASLRSAQELEALVLKLGIPIHQIPQSGPVMGVVAPLTLTEGELIAHGLMRYSS